MTRMPSAFHGVGKLGVDTSPVIYFVESHPKFDSLLTTLFGLVSTGKITAVTSVITLTEVLVHPLRLGRCDLSTRYRDLLLNSEHVETARIDTNVAERAAQLRAAHNLRIPDALQVAAALECGCDAFLTNDLALRRVGDIKVLLLDDMLD